MGRLLSPPAYYGTYYGVCVYPMWGEDFIRKASSLTAERVKTAPEFKLTMAWAERMKMASRLGSAVYAMLPAYRRKHKQFRKLTGLAMRLLTKGNTEGETVVELMLSIQLKKRIRKRRAVVPQDTERFTTRRQPRQSAARRTTIERRRKMRWSPARFQPSSIHRINKFTHSYKMAPT